MLCSAFQIDELYPHNQSLVGKLHATSLLWSTDMKNAVSHKGASNLTKQKAVIRPFIGLLKSSKIGITADREFHSIFLFHWLKKYQ